MALLAGAFLSGCALLVPTEAPSLFDLTIGDSIASVPGSTRSQILIANPKVISSLDTDRIVIKPSAAQIAFFGDVRWADRLPRLVQLYLSRAFVRTGGARAVGLPGDGLLVDHQLLLDITAFQIEVSGAESTAVVEIAVRILNDKNGRVIANQTFANKVPAQDNPVAAVNALNQALEGVSADLIRWVYERL